MFVETMNVLTTTKNSILRRFAFSFYRLTVLIQFNMDCFLLSAKINPATQMSS